MGYVVERTIAVGDAIVPIYCGGALPMALSMLGLFWIPFEKEIAKMTYAVILYLLYGMAFTVFNIPMGP